MTRKKRINLTLNENRENLNLYEYVNGEKPQEYILNQYEILKNAATTLSGGRSDSIFLRLEFSDDEGTQYMFSGLRDTGFPEDQYE